MVDVPGSAAASSLLCDRCGAPLEVGPGARFVTCAHCGSRLGVHRTDSTAWTETLGEVAAATERIESKLTELSVRPRLEALEREWARTHRRLGRRGPGGAIEPPTTAAGTDEARGWIVVGAVAAGGWLAFVLLAAGAGVGALWWLSPAVFLLAALRAIWVSATTRDDVRRYDAAHADYRRRHIALLAEAAGPPDGPA